MGALSRNRAERSTASEWQPDADRCFVLVVEDEPETRLLYEKYLRDTPFQPIAVDNIRQAREVAPPSRGSHRA